LRCRRGVPRKRNSKVHPLLWPPNSPDLNPVNYSVWSVLQEKVYKTRITDLDDLKYRIRIRTELAMLRHVIIAAAVRQRRRRLSACVRAGSWSLRALLLILTVGFCNNS